MELNQFRDVDLVIDRANDNFIQRQFVSQGDFKGRTLTVQITDNGVIGEIPGVTINLYWTNQASGLTDLSAFSLIDKANSVFRLEYPQHMMTPGKVIANIQVIQNGQATHLKPFELTVQKLQGKPVGIFDKAEYSALVAVLANANQFQTGIDKLVINKADKEHVNRVEDLVAKMPTATPAATFKSEAELKTAYPIGSDRPMLVMDATEISYVYFWSGGTWVKGPKYSGNGVADGAVGQPQIADTSAVSANLINPYQLKKNAYIYGFTGSLVEGASDTGLNVADAEFIPVNSALSYQTHTYSNVVEYDADKKYIKASVGTKRIITLDPNTRFIRTSFKLEDIDSAFLGTGATYRSYSPYLFEQQKLVAEPLKPAKNPTWELKTILGTTGAEQASTTRISCGAVELKKGDIVAAEENQKGILKLAIQQYDLLSGANIGNVLGISENRWKFEIQEDGLYRITVGYFDVREITDVAATAAMIKIINFSDEEKKLRSEYQQAVNSKSSHILLFGEANVADFEAITVPASSPYGADYSKLRITLLDVMLKKGTIINNTDTSLTKMQIIRYALDGTFIDVPVLIADNAASYTITEDGRFTIVFAYKDNREITDVPALAAYLQFDTVEHTRIKFENPLLLEKRTYLTDITGNWGSHCWVGEEFWCWTSADYSETGTKGTCYRYTFDDQWQATLVGKFEHNWNHMNSVGYSKNNDTLICCSFVGDYTPEVEKKYEIYVFPDASSFRNQSEVLIEGNAIKIPTTADWGIRPNVTFGESNGGKENIIYYISNDNRDVRKLLLGQGPNDLGSGQFLEGKVDRQFNGSFKLLNEYHTDLKIDINQGSWYDQGFLYNGLGHVGIFYQKMTLQKDGSIDFSLVKDDTYTDTGDLQYTDLGLCGVSTNERYLLFGLQGGILMIYKK